MDNGQFCSLNRKYDTFLDYIYQLISEHESDLDAYSNLDIPEPKKEVFSQKRQEFFIDIIKDFCISVLCGDYIVVTDFYDKLSEFEKGIKELPNKTNDLPFDIQNQIFDISSALFILIETYKDFCKRIENYYSEDKVQFLFQSNTQIQKELSKEFLQKDTSKTISYFVELLKVTSIDHFPSTENKFLVGIYQAERFYKNFNNPLFRDITNVIFDKLNFLQYKWKERRLQENPLLQSYLEDGVHKNIRDYSTTNSTLNSWKEIINTQYELSSNNWKYLLSERVKKHKNKELSSIESKLQIHQLIKYYKDVNPNSLKLVTITDWLFKDRQKNSAVNFYDIYAENVFCNYALNNQFSKFLEETSSLNDIEKKYKEIESRINDSTNNYFLKFKYLNKIFDILTPQISKIGKDVFIKDYENLLQNSKEILESYLDKKEWSIKNYNYIFLLPFKESLVPFKIDDEEYQVFFASTFVLPPSSRLISDDYIKVKGKFDKLISYLDFSKYFSKEISEIKQIKNELNAKDFKAIEIISIFTAIITFVLSSIPAYRFINSVWESLLFMLSLATALSIFVTLILFSTRDLYKKWYAYLPIVGLSGLSFFGYLNLTEFEKERLIINKNLEKRVDSISAKKIDSILIKKKTTPLPQGGKVNSKTNDN